jgi:transcription elongation factor Elf1
MTKYKCGNCGRQFHTPVGPGKIKRYLNNPDLGVELGGETEQEQDQNSSNGQSQSEKQLTLSEL